MKLQGRATSYDFIAADIPSSDTVLRRYGMGKSNLEELKAVGAVILHEVDATKMKHHPDLKNQKFDRIIFNFPHAGFIGSEDNMLIEKALHDMRVESAETKLAYERKLAEAREMMETAQKKFDEAKSKLRSAESLHAEASRYHDSASRNALDIEAREDELRRRMISFQSEFHTVAYVQQIWWLEVDGEIDFHLLKCTYSLYFRLHLGRASRRLGCRVCSPQHIHCWDIKPVHFQLSTSDGRQDQSKCYLDEPGSWILYHVGDFDVSSSKFSTKVKFSMAQRLHTYKRRPLCRLYFDISQEVEA